MKHPPKTCLTIKILLMSTLFLAGSLFAQESLESSRTASPIEGISFRFIESNGIRMRIAEAGEGPLVLMAHGFPESWYSWRHQLRFLADSGYHAVAPDMRGYGETDKPPLIDDYNMLQLTADMIGVLDALGEDTAIMVGHDWGAGVAWRAVMLYPERFTGLIALSVPYRVHGPRSRMEIYRETYGDNFYYMLYHNEPGGVAESEYDADPRRFLSRILLSSDSPREAPIITDPKRSAGGRIGRLGAPRGLPDWLSQEDLDYFVSQFEMSGFRGGVNYYRNIHRNWELEEDFEDLQVHVPVLFIAGSRDGVIAGATADELVESMTPAIDDLREVVLIPGISHWVQQEAPDETNAAMLNFLTEL